jgi:hypothetical protein
MDKLFDRVQPVPAIVPMHNNTKHQHDTEHTENKPVVNTGFSNLLELEELKIKDGNRNLNRLEIQKLFEKYAK